MYKLGFYCVQKQRYDKNGILDQPKIIKTETLEKQRLKFGRLPPKFFGGLYMQKNT